jgi:hypothetical protein
VVQPEASLRTYQRYDDRSGHWLSGSAHPRGTVTLPTVVVIDPTEPGAAVGLTNASTLAISKSERVRLGLERARREGKKIGRPSVQDLVDIDLMLRLRAEGLGWATVHKRHPRTVPTPRGFRRPGEGTIRRVYAMACQNVYIETSGASRVGKR